MISYTTPLRNELLCQLFRVLRQQWISANIKFWHPWQLKKSKSWGPFWSYQLNSTDNPSHLPRKWAKWAKLSMLFSWQLQNAPRILIFSIAMGADYSFEVKNIEIWVPAFFQHNNSSVARSVIQIYVLYKAENRICTTIS